MLVNLHHEMSCCISYLSLHCNHECTDYYQLITADTEENI